MSATETRNAEIDGERRVRRRRELEDVPVRFVFRHNVFEIEFGKSVESFQ